MLLFFKGIMVQFYMQLFSVSYACVRVTVSRISCDV